MTLLFREYGAKNIAVFTHEDGKVGCSLTGIAKTIDCWHTTESINTAKWPFEPDIIASVYYRTIIQQHVIKRANGKIFNAHTSLLPKHRGRSPVSWAIIEGDKTTGVTFHYIDSTIDTGDILMQATTDINGNDTLETMFRKINRLVYDYFPAALELVKSGISGVKQSGEASYHKAGVPYDGKIDSDWPIGKIDRFIRAMIYPPLPPATFMGKEIYSLEEYLDILDDENYYRLAI